MVMNMESISDNSRHIYRYIYVYIEQYQLSRNNHRSQWWIFQRHLF